MGTCIYWHDGLGLDMEIRVLGMRTDGRWDEIWIGIIGNSWRGFGGWKGECWEGIGRKLEGYASVRE